MVGRLEPRSGSGFRISKSPMGDLRLDSTKPVGELTMRLVCQPKLRTCMGPRRDPGLVFTRSRISVKSAKVKYVHISWLRPRSLSTLASTPSSLRGYRYLVYLAFFFLGPQISFRPHIPGNYHGVLGFPNCKGCIKAPKGLCGSKDYLFRSSQRSQGKS